MIYAGHTATRALSRSTHREALLDSRRPASPASLHGEAYVGAATSQRDCLAKKRRALTSGVDKHDAEYTWRPVHPYAYSEQTVCMWKGSLNMRVVSLSVFVTILHGSVMILEAPRSTLDWQGPPAPPWQLPALAGP